MKNPFENLVDLTKDENLPLAVNNFISSIEERHLQSYPSFQKAKTVEEALPGKDYLRRFFLKKAKYEFLTDLIRKVQGSSQSPEWKQAKTQFLSRARDIVRMSMNTDTAFATQEKNRKLQKEEEKIREEKRKNTWV